MFAGHFQNYPIFISDRPLKKYYAIVNDKKIYFGSSNHEQYYDLLGHYKHLNHLDKRRRRLYYARHGLHAAKGSPKWFSHHILWSLLI
jgi:hypothetical protein